MNRSEFILYKGADASIEFVIRDNDRKPLHLAGRKLSMVIVDINDASHILTKAADIIDHGRGLARVRFSPADINDISPHFYQYSVLLTDDLGYQELLLTDLNQSVRGYVEVRDGVLPRIQESREVVCWPLSKLTPVDVGDPPMTQWRSGALPGDSQTSNGDGLHTIAVYTENFTGHLWLQGSLADQPSAADSEWFVVDPGTGGGMEFRSHSGLDAFNFIGNCVWVRFVIQPAPINTGRIERILLKS